MSNFETLGLILVVVLGKSMCLFVGFKVLTGTMLESLIINNCVSDVRGISVIE